jgi:K+-transporting ATPase A subunit
MFSSFWLTLKQQWTIKISSPLFSIFSLVAILVGSRDHRTQLWKGTIQGQFHQSLVAIGPVVSEEKIKMWNVDGRTKSDDNSSHDLKAKWTKNN